MTSTLVYKGQLRTEAVHLGSQSKICTDAPKDNHGKGELFSPTDLLATSLGACMLTTMGIKARDMNVNIEGTACEVEKIMYPDPRRVGEIGITIIFPRGISIDDKSRIILERTAHTCPVAKSLHPDIQQNIRFIYP